MDTRAFVFRGLFCCSVFDKLDAEHQAFAANLTDQIMLFCELLESADEMTPDIERVLLQFFPIDCLKHGATLCAHHRISAERIEVNAFGETLGDLRCSHNSGKRCAVSDPFRHGNNVRDDALAFEAPVCFACSAKAGLHFIRDTDPTCGSHMFINMLEITFREDNSSSDSLNGFRDKSCHSAWRRVLNQIQDIVCVRFAGIRMIVSIGSAIRIWSNRMMDSKAVRDVKFPGSMRG